MAPAHEWPAPMVAVGPVGVGSLLWRSKGTTNLTVVVKARLELRHNDMMTLTDAPALVRRDRHRDDDPTRSLVVASDMVPARRRADVWLTGHAHAPAGRTVSVAVVRLGVYRTGLPMLDKVLNVVGQRRHAEEVPAPFERMPLEYERAFGGIGYDDNPVGVGADERSLVPNVVDPRSERPGGFGPISRYWKSRRRMVTPEVRKLLELPVAEVPDDFDWEYFQAAPEDQRIGFLRGDEWVVLDGVSRTRLRVQSRLPKLTGVARVLPLGAAAVDEEGDAIAMVADTLAIDADRQECSVTWRGALPVASEARLSEMVVVAGVSIGGEALDWRSAYRRGVSLASASADPVLPPIRLDRSGITVVSDLPAPEGVLRELEDPLAKTTVDPPHGVDDGGPAYRRMPEPRRYPRSSESDEITETNVEALLVDAGLGEPSQPLAATAAVDTEPGSYPGGSEEEASWVREQAVEPGVIRVMDGGVVLGCPTADSPAGREPPPSPRRSLGSTPPGPLDTETLAAGLRDAGATEADIAVLLASLEPRAEDE